MREMKYFNGTTDCISYSLGTKSMTKKFELKIYEYSFHKVLSSHINTHFIHKLHFNIQDKYRPNIYNVHSRCLHYEIHI